VKGQYVLGCLTYAGDVATDSTTKREYGLGTRPQTTFVPRLTRPQTLSGTIRQHRRRLGQRGCGTTRMYGFGECQSPKISLASSLETEPAMITSSPCCQLTGVATLCLAVSCSESITRSTSSKLRPVVIG